MFAVKKEGKALKQLLSRLDLNELKEKFYLHPAISALPRDQRKIAESLIENFLNLLKKEVLPDYRPILRKIVWSIPDPHKLFELYGFLEKVLLEESSSIEEAKAVARLTTQLAFWTAEVLVEEVKTLTKLRDLVYEINFLLFSKKDSTQAFIESFLDALFTTEEFEVLAIGLIEDGKKLEIIQSKGENIPLPEELIKSLDKFLKKLEEKRFIVFKDFYIFPIFLNKEIHALLLIKFKKKSSLFKNNLQIFSELCNDLSIVWERVKKRAELEEALFIDELTHLPNKAAFFSTLEEKILENKINKKYFAVIRLDIDNFSYINKILGYKGGDALLKELPSRIKKIFPSSKIFRTGNDEFTFCISFLSFDEYALVLDQLKQLLFQRFSYKNEDISFTLSAGIVIYPSDGTDVLELIEKLSVASAKAKEKGPQSIAFYEEKEYEEVYLKLVLLEELKRAIEKEEFVLFYQPKISLKTEKIVGFEALLRWLHPEKGLIPPGEFIPILEQSGLMVEAGNQVIDMACNFIKKLQRKNFNGRVSINVSAKQFSSELVEVFKNVIEKYKINPFQIEIEVTETLLFEATKNGKGIEILHQLKNLGINISIDDFGTGYSSFLYLKRIPASVLKIDQSFVRGLPKNKEDVEVVKAIVSMGKNLNKKILAEGVETEEQLKFLKELDIDEVQGFYFYKPLPQDQALKSIES